MLKAANVQFRGWKKIGSALCTAFVVGDVAAVRAAVDAGAAAAKAMGGKVISVHVIPRPHDDVSTVLP
jgi:ethanolamine utilization protein EutM